MPKNFKPSIGSGDGGTTALLYGKRVRKTDARITALALLDDLSAQLGFAAARTPGRRAAELRDAQRALLEAAAQTAGADRVRALERGVSALEKKIRALTPRRAVKGFVLSGRDEKGALLHLARTKARLCELALWKAGCRPAARYLNRLSDLLFLLAEAG